MCTYYQGTTSINYLQPNTFQNLYFVPVYSTTRPRNAVDVVLQDDIPPIVGLSAGHYAPSYSYQPLSDYYASAASSQGLSQGQDDLTYRMRPNTSNVLTRNYSQYGPLSWSWKDFAQRAGLLVLGFVVCQQVHHIIKICTLSRDTCVWWKRRGGISTFLRIQTNL